MKKILVRFDDICPTMDFRQFHIAMELMDKYQVKPLLGVIPDCQDPDLGLETEHPDFWEFVKGLQKNGYAIAMHGSNHVFDNHARGNIVSRWDSEFAGHSYEVQLEKIRRGKEIMEKNGVPTNIFFAPGHSYDDNTLKALAVSGFKYISDGLSAKPYKKNGIICVPALSAGMPSLRYGTYHTAVFHAHEWLREDKKYCFNQFIELMEKHHNECLSWDEYVQRPIGNSSVQRILECVRVIFRRQKRSIKKKINSILPR